jgi:hypothetical protein
MYELWSLLQANRRCNFKEQRQIEARIQDL